MVAADWEPRQPTATADWASTKLYLPQETTEAHGLFDLRYVPAMLGIMAALDDPKIVDISCMKSAQQAWTTTVIAYIANRAVNDPAPMILLFDSDGAGKDFYDEKLVPIVNSTPDLGARIAINKTRSRGNRWDFVRFPGGYFKLGGSGQIRKVKSTSADICLVEEPDDAKENLRDQGDSIQLLRERMKRRRNPKFIVGGTPSLKGFSRVEFRVNLGDKRVLPIRCGDCGESHVLDLEHVTWDESVGEPHPVYGLADPGSAVYVCPHCGSAWDDFTRQENIRRTVQDAIDAGDPRCGWVPTAPSIKGHASFLELNEAYSCLPGVGMAEYVKDRLEALHAKRQGDLNKWIVHVNSKQGRPYEFKGDAASAEALEAQALDYPEGQPPSGALALTAFVDVQDNRLSVMVRAYGRDQRSWLVLWTEPAAKVSTHEHADPVWDELDRILFARYTTADGLYLSVQAVGIDSGDGASATTVYRYVQTRQRLHRGVLIMATKGSSQMEAEIFSLPRERAIDPRNPTRATRADRFGVRPYLIGTSKTKDYLDARWKLEASGQGRHHCYATVRADYWAQITSEVKVPSRTQRGHLVWTPKSGVRNEALDCEVGCEHAARGLKLHIRTPAQWDADEMRLRQRDLIDEIALKISDATVTQDGPAQAAMETQRPPAHHVQPRQMPPPQRALIR